ncbi:PREDICTED: armadillo repeat-containing protein 3 [Ceratosolen solmsi marchali]|uniref:Armadillo repeat-containing protein 3 n=1 Tax=Ceratosolen solmsi marchali TaxID=326594 RepID=A0AAJ7DYM7_9HYME|nr:PREDICTED: armadillo repeat-containing protein 3 [Ceratosolen solmsi marchali]
MINTNLTECISGGQEREDRNLEAQSSFEPLSLEVNYPDTAILLLRSPEKPILLAAAASLSRFAEKAKGNLEALFDLNVVENILTMIDHDDLYTRRFALKLLALMSAVQNVQIHLLKTDFYIMLFTKMLTNEQDTFLQEFSSRILAELSAIPSGADTILNKFPDVSYLFEKLKVTDPDVKKNCIEILNNLLKDLNGFNVVSESKDFNFAVIYELFNEPYTVIQQLALNVIEYLLIHNTDDGIHEKFRASRGVQSLVEILNHEDWNDLYYKVLHILKLACYNVKTVEFIIKTDAVRQLFNLMENTKNDQLKFLTLHVLVGLTVTINGKKLMNSYGLVQYMLEYLETYNEPHVRAIICEGLGYMTQYGPSVDEILRNNPVNYILKLLNDDEAQWLERQAAAFALKELFLSDLQNCINFLEINGHEHLIRLIQQPTNNLPSETQVTILQIISAIADYSSLAEDLISIDLFNALSSILERENGASDEMKIACCNVLARFPINEAARKVFVYVGTLKKMYQLITDVESVPVRNAATELVLLLCADPLLATLCMQQGYLEYMLNNRGASRFISTWDLCIEALFSGDLSMKFAYMGQLSLHDLTEDGFYAMRRSFCPFPVLQELFRLKMCPLEPIYVVNFAELQTTENLDYNESKLLVFEEKVVGHVYARNSTEARDVMRRESLKNGRNASESTINAWLELKFGRVQVDYDLITYLKIFKAELEAAEAEDKGPFDDSIPGLIETTKIASRARRLGKFVARQLAGTDPSNRLCIDQQLELHLRSIRDRIQNNIVPLGLLRIGSSFERSLLFKAIADRIALPASLVRGRYGKSWIEIAVPVVSIVIDGSSKNAVCTRSAKRLSRSQALPPKFLYKNFIVDLIVVPGDLIPMSSARAQSYHEAKAGCEFACCIFPSI